MNLSQETDTNLISRTATLVREEREILTALLHHFREIERRRLFASLGFKSLFDMAVRKFGYSEDQAYRRITAMRLLKDLPEMEEKINSGEITLTHIGLAQSLFKQEQKSSNEFSRDKKVEVLNQIANTSTREAERITLSMASASPAIKPDKVKTVAENQIELRFTASFEVQNKIDTLKGLLAHKKPDLSLGELFEQLCDLGLQAWDQSKTKLKKESKSAAPKKRRAMDEADSMVRTRVNSQAAIRREVFEKAQGECENCGSNYALEIDHIFPQAKGGESKPENLRLLCRSCNQRAAIREFGIGKMDLYLNS